MQSFWQFIHIKPPSFFLLPFVWVHLLSPIHDFHTPQIHFLQIILEMLSKHLPLVALCRHICVRGRCACMATDTDFETIKRSKSWCALAFCQPIHYSVSLFDKHLLQGKGELVNFFQDFVLQAISRYFFCTKVESNPFRIRSFLDVKGNDFVRGT